jgi:Fe2+ or Zn2+ uptake regulation protein
MRGIDMAEPSRRRGSGHLAERIEQILRRSRVPLTGIEIVGRMRIGDSRVSNSLVFRALQQLRREGRIRKIEHLNCYAAGGETRCVSLVCAVCGVLRTVEAETFFAAIDALARQRGFCPNRYVIEAAGTCRACAGSVER